MDKNVTYEKPEIYTETVAIEVLRGACCMSGLTPPKNFRIGAPIDSCLCTTQKASA